MPKTKQSQARDSAPDADDAADTDHAAQQETAEARRKREKWERDHARWLRERDEMRRSLFTAFKLWTVCPHKECQRAKACRAVDTEECRRERWREVVPDEVRTLLGKIARLCAEGHSVKDAVRLAREDMRAHDKALAEIEARHAHERAANAPTAAEVHSVPDDRAPRVRGL
jgi:hypothetical protein